MRTNSYLEDVDLETYDDESFDDESFDDEGIGDILQNPFVNLATGGLSGVVGNFVNGGQPRPPLPQSKPPAIGSGVNQAYLQTPAGSAALRLPAEVPTKADLDRVTKDLQAAINANVQRTNSLQSDIVKLRQEAGALGASLNRNIANLEKRQKLELAKLHKRQAALHKMVSSQSTMSMLMPMILQRQLQDQLDQHTHPVEAGKDQTGAACNTGNDDNSTLMLLPLLMMNQGDNGGKDDNSMMMMMMMTLL